jgi:hypothetical protein
MPHCLAHGEGDVAGVGRTPPQMVLRGALCFLMYDQVQGLNIDGQR